MGATEAIGRSDRWFDANGGRFHCVDWGGSGPLLHLAHATGFCAGTYTPLAERLTPHARVTGLDDRGHGQTTVPADPHALNDWDVFAADLESALTQLGEPVIAAGHSRGGTVSLMVAARRPDLVRALILIDPTIFPLWTMPLWFLARLTGLANHAPIASRAARRRNAWPDRETILQSYRSRLPFSRWHEPFLRAYIDEGTTYNEEGLVSWRCDPRWEARCFATCPYDTWSKVPRVRCPVLVIHGLASDTFVRAAATRFGRVSPSATLVGFPDTSHFVPMERPDETAAAIVSFVAAVASRAEP